MAVGDDSGVESASGNASDEIYGNTTTGGVMSPNMALVNGSLNNVCVALPGKINAGSLVGAVAPITVQDILTQTNTQSCNKNSTQVNGDSPLANVLSNIPILSGNGGSLR